MFLEQREEISLQIVNWWHNLDQNSLNYISNLILVLELVEEEEETSSFRILS